MRTTFLLLMLFATASLAADDQIDDLIHKGLAVKETTDSMTPKDIPPQWITSKQVIDSERGTEITWQRGTVTVLKVSWLNKWQGAKERMFTATAQDGTNIICRISGFPDSTAVMDGRQAQDYRVITSLNTNGEFSLFITSDADFMEKIIIKGRESHPIDDLEYTRSAIIVKDAIEPLVNEIKSSTSKQ